MSGVLVLDQSYRPVDHVSIREAASKLVRKEAFAVPGATIIATFHSPSTVIEVPSVIALMVYVEIPKKLSRHITNTLLFARDNWTCGYCGRHKREIEKEFISIRVKGHKKAGKGRKTVRNFLTRDHVKPVCRHEGATKAEKSAKANNWENVITSCAKCNNIKSDQLPYECGMYPLWTPKRPNGVLITIIDRLDDEQLQFVQPYLVRQ